MMAEPCVCGHKKPFVRCCGRFLTGEQQVKTPEQLMRSRYSAYALGNYGDYLLTTWLPASTHGLTARALSEKTLDWLGLDVISSTQTGDRATVEFIAHYRDRGHNPSQDQNLNPTLNPTLNPNESLHEVSQFQRNDGRWFYVSGDIIHPS